MSLELCMMELRFSFWHLQLKPLLGSRMEEGDVAETLPVGTNIARLLILSDFTE